MQNNMGVTFGEYNEVANVPTDCSDLNVKKAKYR